MKDPNPLFTDDLKGMDYCQQIQDIESRCFYMNNKHTFRFNLPDSNFFLWSKRIGRRCKLLLAYPEIGMPIVRYVPFVEADAFMVEKYIEHLVPFFVKFTEYAEWAPQLVPPSTWPN